jgi:hypothetical protein
MATRTRTRRAAPAAGTDALPAADAATTADSTGAPPKPKRPPRKPSARADTAAVPQAAHAAPVADAAPLATAAASTKAPARKSTAKSGAKTPATKPAARTAVDEAPAAATPATTAATTAGTTPTTKSAAKKTQETRQTRARKATAELDAPIVEAAPAPAAAEPAAAAEVPAVPKKPPRRRAKATAPREPVIDSVEAAEGNENAVAPDTPAAAPPAPDAVPLPPYSAVLLLDGDERRLRWIAGAGCPPALQEAAATHADADGFLRREDDEALPTLLRIADETGHALQVEPAVWLQLAHSRDARHRLRALETAYPDGPASPALQALLRAPMAPFQAEGALFATCAGRALIADERGLGKTVQALAAAVLLHHHAGVRRVLLRCTPARRASWQREWARFVREPGLELRIDDHPGEDWTPELVLIDEPQRLEAWDAVDAPFALVLCGAELERAPALLQSLVRFLDCHRQGPLARLAQRGDEALEHGLQTLMLRRRRADVAGQLPPSVQSERVLVMDAPQRAAHDRALAEARALIAGWRRDGRLSDAQQWQLGVALVAARAACHRAEPGLEHSPLADATLAALQDLLGELRAVPGLRIALVCPSAADRTQIERRIAIAGRLALVLEGAALPAADVVIRIGTPWRPVATPGQCIHLVADASLDAGLFDTLALRADIPCGPAEGGREGFLQGARLQRYLLAAEAALNAAG